LGVSDVTDHRKPFYAHHCILLIDFYKPVCAVNSEVEPHSLLHFSFVLYMKKKFLRMQQYDTF